MFIQGSDLILSMNTDQNNLIPVCHSRTCTLSRDRDMLVITDPNGPDERYIPTGKRGTITADGLMVYCDTVNGISVLEWLEAGSLVFFNFTTSENGGLAISGQMYVDHWEESGEHANLVLYSFTARINGAISIQKLPVIKEVYLSDFGGVRLPGCPNAYPLMLFWYDGTVIGFANNADDVITLFNEYEGNEFYELIGTDTGCNFTMSIAWNSCDQPDWIPAEQGAGFVLGETGVVGDNNVIGQTGEIGDNNVIGPIETA